MQNWDDYQLILALHRGKTLRNAAQSLGVNHSTVSRRLAAMQQRFGSSVAEPSPKGFRLTNIGEQLLASALQIEPIIIQDRRLERAKRLELVGEINLSVPPPILQYLLLSELSNFQKHHPQIKLNIQTSYHIADLDSCEADVVVRASNTPDEHLTGHHLFPISVNFYAAKQYLQQTSPEHYQWITDVYTGEKPEWIANTPHPNAPVSMSISDLTLRHQLANQGQGLIRGACYIAHHFENLQPLHGSKPQAFQDLWVLSHPDLAKIPRVQALKSFLTEQLRAKKARIFVE